MSIRRVPDRIFAVDLGQRVASHRPERLLPRHPIQSVRLTRFCSMVLTISLLASSSGVTSWILMTFWGLLFHLDNFPRRIDARAAGDVSGAEHAPYDDDRR